jgi:hypothetical protein
MDGYFTRICAEPRAKDRIRGQPPPASQAPSPHLAVCALGGVALAHHITMLRFILGLLFVCAAAHDAAVGCRYLIRLLPEEGSTAAPAAQGPQAAPATETVQETAMQAVEAAMAAHHHRRRMVDSAFDGAASIEPTFEALWQPFHRFRVLTDVVAAYLTPQAVEILRADPRFVLIDDSEPAGRPDAIGMPEPLSDDAAAAGEGAAEAGGGKGGLGAAAALRRTRARRLELQVNVANPALDRVDQRHLPLNQVFEYELSGEGTDLYLLDSGINSGHEDFGSRVVESLSRNFVTVSGDTGVSATTDPTGHGSMVASQAAGSVSGIAFAARIISVRVFTSNMTFASADVIAGLDYAISTARTIPTRKAVINFSGTFFRPNAIFDAAVTRAASEGIAVVVSGGNDRTDACTTSPHTAIGAFVVGATAIVGSTDVPANFTNLGRCIDIFAVGTGNIGARGSGRTGYERWSGTSFSAPIVSGIALTFRQARPDLGPYTLYSLLQTAATPRIIQFEPGQLATANYLAYSAPLGASEVEFLLPIFPIDR